MLKKLFLLTIFFKSAFIISQIPVWHWAKDANSNSPETLWDVTCDPTSTNVYVCGSFKGNLSAKYGAAFTMASGNFDGLVAKYDALGNVLWAFKIAGTNGDEEVRGVAVDPSGNVYVTGNFNSTVDFDPSAAVFNLTTAGGTDGFIAKYSSAGNFLWAVKFGGGNNENSYKMAADANGIYITGYYESIPTTFYSYNSAVTKTTFFTESKLNMFGAKYNSNGIVQWAISGGSNEDDYGIKVVADASNVYFLGIYYHDISFKNAAGVSGAVMPDQQHNEQNTFILEVTQAGNLGWQTNITSSQGGKDITGWSIAQDAGNLYVTGQADGNINFKYPSPALTQVISNNNDLFLAKLSKASGTFLWNTSATGNGAGDQIGRALEIDGLGNIILGGTFNTGLNYTSVSGPNFTSSGGPDLFITGYSNAGAFLWSYKAGANNTENFNGLATDNSGNIYLAGDHGGAATFGTVTLGSGGNADIYLAKLGCPVIANNTISATQTVCSGNTPSALAGSIPTNGNLYTWEMSANSTTWTSATGTYTNQNYAPPPLTATTYYRRIVNGAGCLGSSSNTLQITVIQPPNISNAGNTQTVCTSSATLNANAATSGAGAWSVITGTATVTNINIPSSAVTGLSFGSNSFVWTISNAPCISSTSTITIIRNIPPVSSAGNLQTVCSTTAALAAVNPTVGVGAWSVIAGMANITSVSNPSSQVTALSTGTNTFLWSVSNGVCPTATSAVNVIRDAMPVSFAGNAQTVCSPNATLAAASPTVGNGNWSVITGTANVTTTGNPSSAVNALNTGTNTFLWTVTNGVCPSATSAVTVLRDIMPSSNAGIAQTVCSSNATLAATNPTVGAGQWTVITGTSNVNSIIDPSSAVIGLSIGSNLFVWSVSNGVCPTATSAVTITRDDVPTVSNAGNDQAVCSTSYTLNANTPQVGTSAWSVITGTSTITATTNPVSQVTNLSVGQNKFVWTISNGVCPSSTSTVTINRDDFPSTALAGNSQSVCAASCTLSANLPSVGIGLWSVSLGTASINIPLSPVSIVNDLSIGQNNFVWTVTNGVCLPSSSTVTVNRDAFPSPANAGISQTICASSVNLNAVAPLIGSGSWSVTSGSGNIVSATNPVCQVNSISAGQNIFTWLVTNGVCISSSSTVSVTRDVDPTASNAGSDQNVCSTSATLNANSPAIGIGQWSLISGTSLISDVDNVFSPVSNLSVGQNKFAWTITNGVCAPSSSTVTVFRNQQPSLANAGIDKTVCGNTVALGANTPAVGTGNWNFISGGGSANDPSDPSSSISNLSQGANIIVWTISNGVCISNSDTVIVLSDAMPTTASAGNDQTVCSDNINFSANAPSVGVGSWSIVSGSATISAISQNNSFVSNLAAGQTIFKWTITNGICPASTDDIIVTRDLPPDNAVAGPDSKIDDPVADLSALTPSIGTGYWSVISGNAQIADPNNSNTRVSNLSFGENIIRWTTRNGSCPENSDDMSIYVNPLRIPNGFSPNNDGFNDAYVIPSLEFYPNVKFNVFNRWGGLVYENNNYKNEWVGTNLSGEKLSDDTYYYVLEINEKTNFTGFIILKQNK